MTRRDPVLAPPAETTGEHVLSPAEQDEMVIGRTRRLADELLAPCAADIDARGEIPPSHLVALAEAGLFGLRTAGQTYGTPCSTRALRRCTELLAAADGSTYFVWLQHQFPLILLKASDNARLRDALLPDVAEGHIILGQALSHLAKPGKPGVVADHANGAWRFSGTVRWYTGWKLNHLILAGAATVDGRAILGFIDPRSPQLRASEPLPTSAMRASQTVTLELRDARVDDDQVIWDVPLSEWLDIVAGQVDVPAGIVGVALAAVGRLAEIAGTRRDGRLTSLARTFTETLTRDRARAYELADEPADPAHDEDRLALKAALAILAVEATTALVVTEGGSSMLAGSASQRWAREALFYLVHGQTAKVREAQARHIISSVRARQVRGANALPGRDVGSVERGRATGRTIAEVIASRTGHDGTVAAQHDAGLVTLRLGTRPIPRTSASGKRTRSARHLGLLFKSSPHG